MSSSTAYATSHPRTGYGEPMSNLDERVDWIAKGLGRNVFGMLAWVDPTGQWWIAPLGSEAPDPDRPIPPTWIPVKRLQRDDMV